MPATATAQKLQPDLPVSEVTIVPVKSAADRDAFIQFQYTLYRNDPNFVPPLMMERKDFLDARKHPWLKFGTAQLFLAKKHGEVVGRIAALDDPRYNEFHQSKVGFFGLFESIDDVEVAKALFDAAGAWCKSRGFPEMLGPMNYSTNYECGVLVDGFDAPPVVMMTYNPRYYLGLYDAAGLTKAKDLWAWELSSSITPPEQVVRVAEKMRKREGVTIRPVRLDDFPNEVNRIKAIYNSAWEKNWGFVPMTDAEFDHLARDLKQMVVPELLMIAEINGEAVAFSMTVPDANVALKAAGGRLTKFGLPIGLAKLVLAARKIKRLRVITLGIKPGFRRRGLDAILYLETIKTARRLGYSGGEMSWTLEDNQMINGAMQALGGRHYKTYRIYSRGT